MLHSAPKSAEWNQIVHFFAHMVERSVIKTFLNDRDMINHYLQPEMQYHQNCPEGFLCQSHAELNIAWIVIMEITSSCIVFLTIFTHSLIFFFFKAKYQLASTKKIVLIFKRMSTCYTNMFFDKNVFSLIIFKQSEFCSYKSFDISV